MPDHALKFADKLEKHLLLDNIVGPIAPLFTPDQPRLPQDLEMLGYGGLGDPETPGQGLAAQILGQEQAQQPQARLVRDGLQYGEKMIHGWPRHLIKQKLK